MYLRILRCLFYNLYWRAKGESWKNTTGLFFWAEIGLASVTHLSRQSIPLNNVCLGSRDAFESHKTAIALMPHMMGFWTWPFFFLNRPLFSNKMQQLCQVSSPTWSRNPTEGLINNHSKFISWNSLSKQKGIEYQFIHQPGWMLTYSC